MLDAGIGNEDVEPAVLLYRALDAGTTRGVVGDVESGCFSFQPPGREFFDPFLQGRFISRIQDHMRARRRQRLRHRPAQAA